MFKHSRSSSGLFLMELILAIFFFMLTSAVCVQIFVQAHVLSRNAKALNFAVNECSSAAELISASDSMDEAETLLNKYYSAHGTAFTGYFDEKLAPCQEADYAYRIDTGLTEKDGLISASIEFTDSKGSSIYSLDLTHYLKGGRHE